MTHPSLSELGWTSHFQSQLTEADADLTPYRLTSVSRTTLTALGENGPARLTLPPDTSTGEYAVGDWLLADGEIARKRLTPFSLLQRRASGPEARAQLMAANAETLGIVTSCNADFNIARLERFIALAFEAEASPVIVLTKSDLTMNSGKP